MKQTLFKQPYATCFFEMSEEDEVYIHLNLREWSPSIYKELLADLAEVREAFHQRGFEYLYVIVPLEDKKLIKFEVMMGFEPELEINEMYMRLKQPTS